jgi:hypothetical protein
VRVGIFLCVRVESDRFETPACILPRKKKLGGREEIRTPDPLLAKQVLSQLSYTPIGATTSF